jgi:Mrp family chromosome partitioning ATPase
MRDLMRGAGELFSGRIVIIDGPPLHGFSDARLLACDADGIIVVVRLHVTPRSLVKKAIAQLDRQKILGIVFNNAPIGHQ